MWLTGVAESDGKNLMPFKITKADSGAVIDRSYLVIQ